MSYTVGQVIFLLLQKELKVIPARVVEQTVTRTMDGEKTSFSVIVPGSTKNGQHKKYPLEKLNAKVYTSIPDARNAMIENATRKIDSILNASKELAKTNFDYDGDAFSAINPLQNNEEAHQETISTDDDNVINNIIASDEVAEVDLGNGMKARINPKNIAM